MSQASEQISEERKSLGGPARRQDGDLARTRLMRVEVLRHGLAALALALVACGSAGTDDNRVNDGPAPSPSSGPGGGDAGPAQCSNEGCACDQPGTTTECKIGPLHFGSLTECIVGKSVCRADGTWSPCMSTQAVGSTVFADGGKDSGGALK